MILNVLNLHSIEEREKERKKEKRKKYMKELKKGEERKKEIYERDKERRGKNMKEIRIICPTFLSTIHGVAQCEARLLCSNKKTASTQTYM